jgi:hypothetical protein
MVAQPLGLAAVHISVILKVVQNSHVFVGKDSGLVDASNGMPSTGGKDDL